MKPFMVQLRKSASIRASRRRLRPVAFGGATGPFLVLGVSLRYPQQTLSQLRKLVVPLYMSDATFGGIFRNYQVLSGYNTALTCAYMQRDFELHYLP